MVKKYDRKCVKKCVECNSYKPLSDICTWSYCNDTYCYGCFKLYVSHEINNNKIPICKYKNCNAKLSVDTIQTTFNKSNTLSHQLSLLYYRKDKFYCNECNKWISNNEIFLETYDGKKYDENCVRKCMECNLYFPYSNVHIWSSSYYICCYNCYVINKSNNNIDNI